MQGLDNKAPIALFKASVVKLNGLSRKTKTFDEAINVFKSLNACNSLLPIVTFTMIDYLVFIYAISTGVRFVSGLAILSLINFL